MELWIWILLAVVIVALVVVVFATLRAIRPKAPEPLDAGFAAPAPRPSGAARSARTPVPTPPSPAAIAEIDALVAEEQRISAIKVLRESTGLSLRDAKDQIDAWVPSARGTTQGTPAPRVDATSRPAGAPSSVHGTPVAAAVARVSPEVRAEIGRLVAAEQKIAAIKLLREATGLGLKDSKDAIDSWR